HAHHTDLDPQATDKGIEKTTDPNTFREEYGEEYSKISYDGNFEGGILIIYQGSGLESDSREFLMKVMGAVGYSLKDVAMMSANQLLASPTEIISRLNAKKCLVFGTVNHPLMKLKREDYEVISGEILFLFADDLKELAENVPLKKKLWTSLQVLFNINK